MGLRWLSLAPLCIYVDVPPARLDVNHGRADVWGTMQVEVFLTLLDDYIL